MIIGQTRVVAQLKESILPRFLLISGAKGSGKRTLVRSILEHMNYEFIESQKVDDIRAVIESTYTLSEPKFFVFPDAQNMTTQAQNAFLKSLEEPAKNAYVIMTVNSVSNVLKTIKSRASVVHMEGYTKEDLSLFTEEETLLKMCSTPGQIKRYLSIDWEALVDHCDKVINNIDRISIGNVFNILKHVDKENYDLLLPTIEYVYGKQIVTSKEIPLVLRKMQVIKDTGNLLNYSASVNVQNALETMFLKLWEVSR